MNLQPDNHVEAGVRESVRKIARSMVFVWAVVSSVLAGCASNVKIQEWVVAYTPNMQVPESVKKQEWLQIDISPTLEPTEKRLQKKFAWMPLVFGSKSNTIPDKIKVTASKNKKGIYVLELPYFDSISEQDFEVNDNWDITSDIVVIKFAQFDAMADILAKTLNLKEGEKYKVTLEWWTMHIRLLPSNTSTDIASSDGNAI